MPICLSCLKKFKLGAIIVSPCINKSCSHHWSVLKLLLIILILTFFLKVSVSVSSVSLYSVKIQPGNMAKTFESMLGQNITLHSVCTVSI